MDSPISYSPSHTQRNQNPSSSLPSPLNNRVQRPTITTRTEPGNLYPTTFVEADASCFKQVVQMLTGPSKPANPPMSPINRTHSISPIKSIVPKKHHHHHHQHQHTSAFKLYERRNSRNRSLNVNNLVDSGLNRQPEIMSPGILNLHSLTLLSPVTPLTLDLFDRSGPSESSVRPYLDMEAEEQAIKEKRFFLHPSPISAPRNSKPRLLPLFPISPRDSSR